MKTLTIILTLFLSLPVLAQVPEQAEDISPLLIGETIPDAILLDPNGNQVSVNSLIKNKPTVLVFYRGGWCPYCNNQLSALGESEQEIMDLGYQIIAVSPDHVESLQPTIEGERLSYSVFADPKAEFIQAVGIGFKTPEKAKGYIFKKTQKEASDILPVPTVMIVDTKGKILYEYINPDYSTRLSSELLLANLIALKKTL
ncbi:peroxiredoxin-like family protein [Hanstruepera ponticola]|uniref:peroxiredoxin-like family protein n=1 Tax=Hanstruepera ponticola TaxID=2042995 RepID=UPI000CF17BAA|nr:peroxiredoxin-like family protein [Hanstruepera ponticola]